MAGDCGLNALSLLPENELPQWQQKIAIAENNEGRCIRLNYATVTFRCRSA